jgi:NAD-dependent SIR2 family protein deacetylase
LSLLEFIHQHSRIFVLTGAGVSTASGIPDYRDSAGEWKHRKPVDYREFVRQHATRQRYWARSAIGWPLFNSAEPNTAHLALATLQKLGEVSTIVTQNVDGLHRRAGSSRVIDLHGNLDRVICLDCRNSFARSDIQNYLLTCNPQLKDKSANLAPDGDVNLDGIDFSRIEIPNCANCNGILKPDVVFFGETVPSTRLEKSLDALARADAVLVVGSSLMVYSGYRFVVKAQQNNIPVAAINLGVTRADDLLCLKLERDCGETLADLVVQVSARGNSA